MTARVWTALAALIVLLEGIGLLVFAGWEVTSLATGNVVDPVSGIALIVLTLLIAAGTIAFGYGILRGRSWGRSGGIVAQLLALVIAFVLITGSYAPEGASDEVAAAIATPVLGFAIGIGAVIAFVGIIVSTRASAPKQDRPVQD